MTSNVKNLVDDMNASTYEAEQLRLSVIRKLKIIDSPFETVFDSIAKLAGEICNMPISLITIIDENKLWFKANVGLPGFKENDRTNSFCNVTILSDEIFEVQDATKDKRFVNNILVSNGPKIRFYAGVPISLPLGEKIGALCVIDVKPNSLNEHQRNVLNGLAKIVSTILVARSVSLKVTENVTTKTLDF